MSSNRIRDLPKDMIEAVEEAKLTSAARNALPDLAFAVIKTGGKKDESGKTVPRDLRMLPHHTATVAAGHSNASVDRAHLRNALARVEQSGTQIASDQRSRARAHLMRHAKALGIGEMAENHLSEANDLTMPDRLERVTAAWYKHMHNHADEYSEHRYCYIIDIYDSYIIYKNEYGHYYKMAMTVDADGNYTFAEDMVEVEKVWVPVEDGDADAKESASQSTAPTGKPSPLQAVTVLRDKVTERHGTALAALITSAAGNLEARDLRIIHAYLHYGYGQIEEAHNKLDELLSARKVTVDNWDDPLDRHVPKAEAGEVIVRSPDSSPIDPNRTSPITIVTTTTPVVDYTTATTAAETNAKS